MQTLLRHKRLVIALTVSLSVLVPFFYYFFYLGRSGPAGIDALCAERSCLCGDWYREPVGEYRIENNPWNKGQVTDYRQCVFISQGDGGVDAGWAWNWPGVRFNVVAYPNVMFGKNPWLIDSTSPELPAQIGDIDCLEADFDVVRHGSGKGNLAFDLWVTGSPAAEPSDITREIMIWLSHRGRLTAGSQVASLDLGGRELGLWKREDHNPVEAYRWTYLAFVYRSDFDAGSIDLAGLLSYLVDNGHLSADEYLSSIQLGNEIVSGYGQTVIRDFRIRFCDQAVRDCGTEQR